MKISLPHLLLPILCALLCTPALAEKADRDKPMNIEADALRYDDVRQLSVFSGNVLLSKGSILIRGAQVEVRQDADGFQYGLITGTADKPAFFRQKRDGVDETLEGAGQTIAYDGKTDTIRFTGDARLRRLRTGVLSDEISGAQITYENLTDTFRVDGHTERDPALASGGRIRAMLSPRQDAGTADKGDKGDKAAPLRLQADPALPGASR